MVTKPFHASSQRLLASAAKTMQVSMKTMDELTASISETVLLVRRRYAIKSTLASRLAARTTAPAIFKLSRVAFIV